MTHIEALASAVFAELNVALCVIHVDGGVLSAQKASAVAQIHH